MTLGGGCRNDTRVPKQRSVQRLLMTDSAVILPKPLWVWYRWLLYP